MGTAILNETGVLDEKDVWAAADDADELKPPRTKLTDAELDEIGISERDYSKMSDLERSAYRLKLKGHEVYVVDESDDEEDVHEYLSPDILKYLAAKREEWRKKDEEANNAKIY